MTYSRRRRKRRRVLLRGRALHTNVQSASFQTVLRLLIVIIIVVFVALLAWVRGVADAADAPRGDGGFGDEEYYYNCPAMFTGQKCDEPKAHLPRCIDGAFDGGWISLHRNVVVDFSGGEEENDFDARYYWHVPKDISEETAALLPTFDAFGDDDGGGGEKHREMNSKGNDGKKDAKKRRRAIAKSCAIVSSAASMSGSNLGAEIDANEVVVRFNNAPTKGYEKDVGKKTSLRLTNAIFQGYREKDDEAVLAKWCQEQKLSHVPCGQHEELRRLVEKKTHALNPRFIEYANSRYFRKLGEHASSGMVMTLLLLHKCEKVTLYGFNGKNMKRWYYPKRRKGESAPNKKDWLREKRWAVDGEWLHARSSGGLLDTNLGGDEEYSREEEESARGQRRRRRRRFSRSSPGRSWNPLSLEKEEEVEVEVEEEERGYHSSAVSESSVGSGAYGRRTLLHAVKAERVCMKQLESLGFVTVVTA